MSAENSDESGTAVIDRRYKRPNRTIANQTIRGRDVAPTLQIWRVRKEAWAVRGHGRDLALHLPADLNRMTRIR